MKNIYFIHINKTSGTSIGLWINTLSGFGVSWGYVRDHDHRKVGDTDWTSCGHVCAPDHLVYKEGTPGSHDMPTEFHPDVFYFTIVRNPYNRMASHFYSWGKENLLNRSVKEDLNAFIQKLPQIYETNNTSCVVDTSSWNRDFPTTTLLGPVSPKFVMPCTFWIKDFAKVKIFKFEEREKMEGYFQQNLGVKSAQKIQEIHSERTATKKLKSYVHLYTRESLDIINRLFREDFENFGYEVL